MLDLHGKCGRRVPTCSILPHVRNVAAALPRPSASAAGERAPRQPIMSYRRDGDVERKLVCMTFGEVEAAALD